MKKIGAITVGQTPRTDLIPEIAPILGDSIEIIQMGGDGRTDKRGDPDHDSGSRRSCARIPLKGRKLRFLWRVPYPAKA